MQVVLELDEEQHHQQSQKCREEKSVGFHFERFVFSNCFGLGRPRLENFSAIGAGSRINKAKTVTAQTFCKIHILSPSSGQRHFDSALRVPSGSAHRQRGAERSLRASGPLLADKQES